MAQRKYITHEMIDAILEMHDARPELNNIQLAKCFAISNGTVGKILNGQHPLQIEKNKKQEANNKFDNLVLVSALRDIGETLNSIDTSLLLIADALIKDEPKADREDEHAA